MTLELKIRKITGKSTENCQLIISSKTTGNFIIHNFYPEQDERRKVYFSIVDCLQMSLYDCDVIPNAFNRKAFINLPCELIVQFLEKSQGYKNEGISYQYDIQLYTQKDQPYATVHMMVKYTSGLLLQGILPNSFEKKLRSFTFFKGGFNGKTSNFFNFLDFCCQPQSHNLKFKAIENIYDDLVQ